MQPVATTFADFSFASWADVAGIAAPFGAAFAAWWVISHMDGIMGRIFPDAQWEHSLGWLNMGAERRANRALRWLGYALYVLLFDALVGIVWAANGLPELLAHWSDPYVIGAVLLHLGALLTCLMIWFLYLGCGLLPAIRARQEMASLRADRSVLDEREREREGLAPGHSNRVYGTAPQPRNKPLPQAPMSVPPRWRRSGPGG